MPLLDWVNRNQAEETADNVPYHLLKFEEAYGEKQKQKITYKYLKLCHLYTTIKPYVFLSAKLTISSIEFEDWINRPTTLLKT